MVISKQTFDSERALYALRDSRVEDCAFDGPADGESAFKESRNIIVDRCFFNLRYPFWHTSGALIRECHLTDKCRAALWYDSGVTIENSRLHGIKALRESEKITLSLCDVISPEFLWRCRDIKIKDTTMQSEYPFFECADINIDNLTMKGKYSFQYVDGGTIVNSDLDTKDAFWHSKNLTVTDSIIKGEYLGWYSENLRLVRCKIIGTQPLCYCRGLVLEDCQMEDTDLSFEKSEVEAKIIGNIVSVKNPVRGHIYADSIGEVILRGDDGSDFDASEVTIDTKK